MTIDRIDWSKLKPYATDKRRSFEELCFQLVRLEYGAKARIVRVDGSGGDGGVEFYITQPNGDELGWQAKFFWPDVRLTPSRKKQIKESLQKACLEHPRLVSWMLMTPSNLTKAEQIWFDTELCRSTHNKKPVVPAGRALTLTHVPESELVARLTSPKAQGLRSLFFGEIELSLDWFQKVAGEATFQLRRKFLPTLHAETSIDAELEYVLADDALADVLQQRVLALAECLENLASARSTFDRVVGADADTAATLNAGRLASDASIATLQAAHDKARTAIADLQAKRWRAARNARPVVGSEGADAFRAAWQAVERLPAKKVNLSVLAPNETREWRDVESPVRRWTRAAWGEVTGIDEHLDRLSHSEVHIFGAAGQGKTHVSAHQVVRQLESGRPALLLLGARFTSDEPIEAQILKLLHLDVVGWDQFVAALAACADTYGTRIPIVIDGLNEALRNGGLSPVWKNHLAATCAGLKQRTDAVILVTTCRGTYEEAIWDGDTPQMRLELDASTNYDVREAVDIYFDEYKIVADPTSSPLEHFQHPIYLRIFCEAYNPERATVREVSLGEETLFRVFDRFLAACDDRARDRLKRLPGVRLVGPALERLGGFLWTASRRTCPMSEAALAIEEKPLGQIDADGSLIGFLEQEDVLILRDWFDVSEQVGFAYDLMGGYCIARYLIEQQRANPSTFSDLALANKLFADTFTERHPLAEDIVRSLAVLCPALLKQRIDKLIPHERAFGASIIALFEGDPAQVGADEIKTVATLFDVSENRLGLVELCDSVAVNPSHPLNADFLSRILEPLPMPERDSSWTEYVRKPADECQRRVLILEEASRAHVRGEHTLVAKPRLQLLARYAQWLLTSTIHPLRDEATRALYWFGRAFPMELLELTKAALSFNDFYVPERLLAAQYGVMMARAWERGPGSFEDALAPIARTIFDLVFARRAPFPLVHFLARDFAQNTVRRALVEQPSLLTAAERKLLVMPFASIPIPDWPSVDEPYEGKYKDGDSPLRMDFANYTLGRLVPKRSNYDFKHPEYKKVRGQIIWRIVDLGYSLERFGEIDKEISRTWYYGRGGDSRRIDRYGKKYAWIAFYELAGVRSVKGLLKTSYDDRPRLSDIDIEPSFPSDPRGAPPPFVPAMVLPPLDPLHVWIRDGGVPDLKPLLVRNDVLDNADCVLLDAYMCEEDGQLRSSVWLQSYIVSSSDAERIVAAAAEGRLNDALSHASGDHYTFAGEYPWLPELEPNGRDDIELSLPSVKRKRVQEVTRWFRDGKEIDVTEASKLLVSDDSLALAGENRRTWLTHVTRQMQKHKITLKTTKRAMVEDRPRTEKIEALRTVRDYSWESYHTTTAEGRNFSTLAPEIARALALHARPDEWELFQSDGTQVTRNIVYGEPYGTGGSFVYARRSAMEKYLGNEDKALIIIAAGERIIGGEHLDRADEAYKLSGGRGTWDRAWIVLDARTKAPRRRQGPKRTRR